MNNEDILGDLSDEVLEYPVDELDILEEESEELKRTIDKVNRAIRNQGDSIEDTLLKAEEYTEIIKELNKELKSLAANNKKVTADKGKKNDKKTSVVNGKDNSNNKDNQGKQKKENIRSNINNELNKIQSSLLNDSIKSINRLFSAVGINVERLEGVIGKGLNIGKNINNINKINKELKGFGGNTLNNASKALKSTGKAAASTSAAGGKAAAALTQVGTKLGLVGAIGVALVGVLAAMAEAGKYAYERNMAVNRSLISIGASTSELNSTTADTSNKLIDIKNTWIRIGEDLGRIFQPIFEGLVTVVEWISKAVEKLTGFISDSLTDADEDRQKQYTSSDNKVRWYTAALEERAGIPESKSVPTIGEIASSAKQSGFDNTSAANLAVGTYSEALKIAKQYGIEADEVAKKLANAWLTGSKEAKDYGVVVDDVTLKGYMAAKGVDIVNVQITDAMKQYYRYQLMQEELNDANSDAMQQQIKQWKQLGMVIDSTKNKLFSFDEVINLQGLDTTIPEVGRPDVYYGDELKDENTPVKGDNQSTVLTPITQTTEQTVINDNSVTNITNDNSTTSIIKDNSNTEIINDSSTTSTINDNSTNIVNNTNNSIDFSELDSLTDVLLDLSQSLNANNEQLSQNSQSLRQNSQELNTNTVSNTTIQHRLDMNNLELSNNSSAVQANTEALNIINENSNENISETISTTSMEQVQQLEKVQTGIDKSLIDAINNSANNSTSALNKLNNAQVQNNTNTQNNVDAVKQSSNQQISQIQSSTNTLSVSLNPASINPGSMLLDLIGEVSDILTTMRDQKGGWKNLVTNDEGKFSLAQTGKTVLDVGLILGAGTLSSAATLGGNIADSVTSGITDSLARFKQADTIGEKLKGAFDLAKAPVVGAAKGIVTDVQYVLSDTAGDWLSFGDIILDGMNKAGLGGEKIQEGLRNAKNAIEEWGTTGTKWLSNEMSNIRQVTGETDKLGISWKAIASSIGKGTLKPSIETKEIEFAKAQIEGTQTLWDKIKNSAPAKFVTEVFGKDKVDELNKDIEKAEGTHSSLLEINESGTEKVITANEWLNDTKGDYTSTIINEVTGLEKVTDNHAWLRKTEGDYNSTVINKVVGINMVEDAKKKLDNTKGNYDVTLDMKSRGEDIFDRIKNRLGDIGNAIKNVFSGSSISNSSGAHFASGGIGTKEINNATLFEGNKKEAVIPLESQEGINFLAAAMKQAQEDNSQGLSGGGSNVTINLTLQGIFDTDDRGKWEQLAERLSETMDIQSQRRGSLGYGASY